MYLRRETAFLTIIFPENSEIRKFGKLGSESNSFPPPATMTTPPNPYAAAAAPALTPRPIHPLRRLVRRLVQWALLLTLLLVLLLAGLWAWAGSAASLEQTLQQAARLLPAGQQLQAEGVSGTLRAGGSIQRLQWSNAQLALDIEQLDIRWQLPALLQRRLPLNHLSAARLHLRAQGQPPPPDSEPLQPLQQLTLPLQVQLPFAIAQLQWQGRGADAQPLVIEQLTGQYRYQGQQHQLQIDSIALAQGRYQLRASLDALAPMALQAQLDGQVHSAIPGSQQTVQTQAQARIEGPLAGAQARLHASAQLRPTLPASAADSAPAKAPPHHARPPNAQPSKTSRQTPSKTPPTTPTAPALHADFQAVIAPWQPQPLQQAQARLQALNLAQLWPQAPATLLSGQARLEPQGTQGWQIQADLANARPGPWDQQQLPLSALQAQADYDGSAWHLPQARLQIGSGSLRAQGRYDPARQALQGQLQLENINPALLHSQFAPAPVSGQASASSEHESLRFGADLQASRPSAPPRAASLPALQRLQLQGQWQDGRLDLGHLQLQVEGASLRAQALQLDTREQALRARLQVELPGASAQAEGQIARHSGSGQLALRLSDAPRLQTWLARLPLALPALQLQGQAELDAQWRGGWQAAQQQWRPAWQPASRPAAEAFSLQAELRLPRLHLEPPASADQAARRIELHQTSARLRGNLAQLTLELDGQGQLRPAPQGSSTRQPAGQPELQAQWQLRASASQQGGGRWQAHITDVQLQADSRSLPGPWTLRLAEPVALQWQPAPQPGWQVSAASAQLTGPQPGQVLLRWQPLHYAPADHGKPMELSSQGQIQGLPLAWANAVQQDGQGLLTQLGLSGDLQLGARWNLQADAGGLRAQASLQRDSGDLQLASGDTPNARTAAGLRALALELNAQGDALQARLHWDSQQAGQLQAQASTRLSPQADGSWQWSADAPLTARLRAELPDLGVWARLAPPGWRVQGQINADLGLSGSRTAPQWSGQLRADQLAIRSLLDGIDLQQGRLRATLQGQQLDITELQLSGGRGSRARIAGYSGNRSPAPTEGGTLQGSGQITWAAQNAQGQPDIRMQLRAQADHLQVLVRADRQVSISGHLQAQLEQGQFTLRGDLGVDRATLLLPEAGAPALGDDVVLLRPGTAAKAAAPPATPEAAASVRARRPPDLSVQLDLGDDFAVQGLGLSTRLTGQLHISANAASGGQPRVIGEIRTDQGRYRAWGQSLDVESGLVRFHGPYDNPALDILALRPNIPVRAGVRVGGNALAPRVRLYAEPELPDAEKLSWVVLGRSASAGAAEAALMQQAALAFLSGNGDQSSSAGVAQRLGLDEIGFKGPAEGQAASSAALTLGKRLSRDLYVTYERSLSGALGTLYIFYDLSKHLTLRGQTGAQSAMDVIYTVRYE